LSSRYQCHDTPEVVVKQRAIAYLGTIVSGFKQRQEISPTEVSRVLAGSDDSQYHPRIIIN